MSDLSSPVPAPESHTSQAATFISEPNRSETMSNTTCPCGNPIILDGLVVKAHWEGKVCQDCESEMFKKHEARFQRALGPIPSETFRQEDVELVRKAANRYGDGSPIQREILALVSRLRSQVERMEAEMVQREVEVADSLAAAGRVVESLQADLLTPAEKRLCLHVLETTGHANSITKALRGKLSRLSSDSGTGGEA